MNSAALHTADDAESHNQQCLSAGNEVAHSPECRQQPRQSDPQTHVMVVLLSESFALVFLPPECTDDPNSGKVLLSHGRENTLVLVALAEVLSYAAPEYRRVEQYHRHCQRRRKRQLRVHRKHHGKRENDLYHYLDDSRQLFRQKFLHGIHVGGTALDDVPGAVFHVPAERKPFDVRKKQIAHRFDKRLGGFCVVQSLDITEHRGQKRENGYRRRDYPEPLSQHRHPSDKVDDAVCKSRQSRFFLPDHGVNRKTDYLRIHKIYCRKHKRGDHTHGKKTLASVKEHKEQTSRRNCPSAGILFFFFLSLS